jgi:hypothetical protein
LQNKYSIYPGKWPCKTCQEEVLLLRLWIETGDATWMCSKKHISRVSLVPKKKKKKDFTDE